MTSEDLKLITDYTLASFDETDWRDIMGLVSMIELSDSIGSVWMQIVPSGCIITHEQRDAQGFKVGDTKQYISVTNRFRKEDGKKKDIVAACVLFLKSKKS